MVLIVNSDGVLTWNYMEPRTSGITKAVIDLPAELVTQQSDLFDRVFAIVFDVLGFHSVELRIRAVDAPAR